MARLPGKGNQIANCFLGQEEKEKAQSMALHLPSTQQVETISKRFFANAQNDSASVILNKVKDLTGVLREDSSPSGSERH